MKPSDEKFCHPYEPYDIQVRFMQQLYQCIEDGNVGIFESPTGTGKSLSLICGALTWLRDNSRRELEQPAQIEDGSDWLATAEADNRRREFLHDREDLEKRLRLLREEETARNRAKSDLRSLKRAKLDTSSPKLKHDLDDEFVLEDYDDKESVPRASENLSTATQALLDRLKPSSSGREETDPVTDNIKIIFCSRTHSQLTQFVHELIRVTPPSGLPFTSEDGIARINDDLVKHLPLGSRKNLCINPDVNRLNSTMAINERCLDLQKANAAKAKKCPFVPTKETRDIVESFSHRAIAKIRDIEDIASLGREMAICPYYASRSAIVNCEILTLPYPLLLQKAAREALGVYVKGNVVVIDEAHNLMDAIADTMSTTLSLTALDLATKQLTFYVQRFKARLKGSNRVYITQILRLINSITDFLRSSSQNIGQNEVVTTAAQLMSGKGVDQIQPHKLLEYLQNSKLVHKVEGYTKARADAGTASQPRGVLFNVQAFFNVLMNPDAEGCFFVARQGVDMVVKYTLLDPRQHFRDIVEDARAIILAGGTMSPMSDYADYLFSYLDPLRLKTFSFGHVIPKENLFVKAIRKGSSGIEFDFTFANRNSERMIVELGETILRACAVVPDGIVAFFPSYDVLARMTSTWKQKPSIQSIFSRIGAHKQIFEETRGDSVDQLLQEFRDAIDGGKGGLMLSVIGGKLSEGINFSDSLGRAVIAIGLPFPNIHSGEWKAKIEHVERARLEQCVKSGVSDIESKLAAKAAGRDFYENICMRAINQSIGRAIRHRNDYAAILLFDRRFESDRIKRKLPQWITSSMQDGKQSKSWTDVERSLHTFFGSKATS